MDNREHSTTFISSTVGQQSSPPESLITPKGTTQSEDVPSSHLGSHSVTNKSPFRSPWSPSGTNGFGSSKDTRQLQGSGLYESLLFGASDTTSGADIPSYGQHKSMELNLETALADDPSVASSALTMSRSGGSMWQATTPLEKGAAFGGSSTSRLSSEKFWGSPGSLPSRPYGQVPDTPLSSSRGLYSSGKFPGAVTLSPEARVWTPSTIDSHYLSPQRPYDPTNSIGALSAAATSSPEALLPGSPPGWNIPDLSTHEESNHADYTTPTTDPCGAGVSSAFGARALEGQDYNWMGEMASQGDMSAAMDSLMQQAALLASTGTTAVANSASHQQAMLALLLSSTALQMQLVAASGGMNGSRSTSGSAQLSLASPPSPPSFPPPGLSSSESRVKEASAEQGVKDWKDNTDAAEWSANDAQGEEGEDRLSSRLRVASDRDNAEASSIIKECGRRGDIRSCWKVWNHLVTTGQCLSNWRSRGGENRHRGNGEASSPSSSPSSSPGVASIYRPNEITLGCMTDALVSNRLVEEAEQLVGEWKELIPPNTVIYSTLIHGWAKQNDANRARSIFALMRDENVLCNAVTFNCLIHACVRVGDMQGALELLDAMKLQAASATATTDGGINDNNSNNGPSCDGSDNTGRGGGLMVPLPDKFTYSTIIKGYCARGEMEQSLQMFDTMLNDGLQPDLVIYNTLLDGCVKRRYHGTCERLLDDMTNYWKIQPNSYTLSILIKHYGRQGDLERAFKLVEELPAKHGFDANAHVWTCLISACITHGEMETAQAIFDVMRKVKPSRRQNGNDANSGGFDSPNPALATPTILRMAAKCAPDAKAYETQIHGWMKYNRQDRVKELTEDLERKFGMPGYSRSHHHHRGSRRG